MITIDIPKGSNADGSFYLEQLWGGIWHIQKFNTH
jgi:hypothetical protein